MRRNVTSHKTKRQAESNSPPSRVPQKHGKEKLFFCYVLPSSGQFTEWIPQVNVTHFSGWISVWRGKKNSVTALAQLFADPLLSLFIRLRRWSLTYCCLLVGNGCQRCQSPPEQVLPSTQHQGRLSQRVPATHTPHHLVSRAKENLPLLDLLCLASVLMVPS